MLSFTDNADDEDGFRVESTSGTGSSSVLRLPRSTVPAPAAVTSVFSGLTPGTQYGFKIRSYNLAGYTEFTGIERLYTLDMAPTALKAAADGGFRSPGPLPQGSCRVIRSTDRSPPAARGLRRTARA